MGIRLYTVAQVAILLDVPYNRLAGFVTTGKIHASYPGILPRNGNGYTLDDIQRIIPLLSSYVRDTSSYLRAADIARLMGCNTRQANLYIVLKRIEPDDYAGSHPLYTHEKGRKIAELWAHRHEEPDSVYT